MHLEEFAAGSSLMHRLDPRAKLVAAVLFSVVVAVSDRFPVMAAGLAGALVLLALAGLELRLVLIRLAMVKRLCPVPLAVHLPFPIRGGCVRNRPPDRQP
jgi:cobalt/nickel transport system permease protein